MDRRLAVAAAILAAVVTQSASATGSPTNTLTDYAQTVTGICAGALLFEGRHEIGTRAGHSKLPDVLRALIHRPDRLGARAQALEQALGVPDCTGGLQPPAPSSGAAIG
jgi:hypothetical protein